ncbi:unnamed protein product [Caenorhabditis nigoni]
MEANGDDNSGKEDPRKCSYMHFPTKFAWSDELGKWKERLRGGDKVIGRIYAVTPRDPERFALRLLLLATSGASSFEDLRTVPDENGDAIFHPTLVLTARAIGLLLGKDIQSFITPPKYVLTAPLIDHIDFDDIRKEGDRLIDTLDPLQTDEFRRIIEAVDDPCLQRLFFLDGPRGSGKTYLHNVIWKVLLGKRIKIA